MKAAHGLARKLLQGISPENRLSFTLQNALAESIVSAGKGGGEEHKPLAD